VSYKIIGTIFLISTLINQAYLPALVKTFSAKYVASRETVDIFSRSLRSVFFWSIPITFGAMMLADRIILFVFGPEYMAGVNAFRILIWNCIIYFLSSAMTNLIYAGRKQKKAMVIFFLGAAANTIFNIFMIPMFGIEGAALTTVLAEIVVLAGIYILARKIAPIKIFGNLLTPLLAGIVMAGSLFFIKAESLIITIAIGSVVYFGTYFLLLKFSQSWGGEQILAAAETGNESLPKESP
jgi:O-antigen/teichoic acid export membrane protein